MTRTILLLILIINFYSCQSQTDKNYADDLNGCLLDTDIELLNRATLHFEKLLAEHYENSKHNENFYSYLTTISSIQTKRSLKADFFLESKSIRILEEMEKAGTFDKIWTEFIENESEEETVIALQPGYEEPEKEKLELFVLNPNGMYIQCINQSPIRKEVKDVLNSQSEYGDVAPSIIAGALRDAITESDLEKGLNKVIISIGFYYNIVNLLNKNPL
ncbi:hypothetical protein MG296_14415 [Flavobacteriaceae bacterium TK19130]|nr:hypothetical protein [Thermobacterium salinum]